MHLCVVLVVVAPTKGSRGELNCTHPRTIHRTSYISAAVEIPAADAAWAVAVAGLLLLL